MAKVAADSIQQQALKACQDKLGEQKAERGTRWRLGEMGA